MLILKSIQSKILLSEKRWMVQDCYKTFFFLYTFRLFVGIEDTTVIFWHIFYTASAFRINKLSEETLPVPVTPTKENQYSIHPRGPFYRLYILVALSLFYLDRISYIGIRLVLIRYSSPFLHYLFFSFSFCSSFSVSLVHLE